MKINNSSILILVMMVIQCAFAKEAQRKPSNWMVEKSTENRKPFALINSLDSMALLRDSLNLSKPEVERIERLLEGFSAPEKLFKIAVLAKVMFSPAMAEHQYYDQIFEDVFWTCAIKLSKRSDDEAVRHLSELRRVYGVDGGDSLQLRELSERQGKLPKGKRK